MTAVNERAWEKSAYLHMAEMERWCDSDGERHPHGTRRYIGTHSVYHIAMHRIASTDNIDFSLLSVLMLRDVKNLRLALFATTADIFVCWHLTRVDIKRCENRTFSHAFAEMGVKTNQFLFV